MAPTKKESDKGEKEAKLTPEQSAAVMLDYLRKQNRPYSATDISANLKNRVSKAAAAKLLKDMHERGDIEGRAAGKQMVYHAVQDGADETSFEKLQEMEEETKRLKQDIVALKVEEKELRQTLREGASQVPLPELKTCVTMLEHQKAELIARFTKLQSGTMKPVSLDEREKVSNDHRYWEKTANARTKIRNEMLRTIEDMTEKEQFAQFKDDLALDFEV